MKNSDQPSPVVPAWTRRLFFACVAVLAIIGGILLGDFFWRTGWSPLLRVLWCLYAVLFGYIAFGCMHAVFGFFRIRSGHRAWMQDAPPETSLEGFSTAVLVPVYNEDPERVFSGVAAVYESLKETGQGQHFDFFILSDTTDPDKWVEEERTWFRACRNLGALGRIFYRRRERNEGKKAGNVASFCRAWGKRYRYMIVFDADSVMSGETLVEMVKRMEVNQRCGLLQTVPALALAETLFGRLFQFAARLYGPVFLAGLDYWQGANGNYWGHNAIIRVAPFMKHCELPVLPGKAPLGGQVLSHDFVEAALLRRAGWEVWLAPDLGGSYEEGPPDLIEAAKRDRRWCQGNLQHAMLLLAQGFRGLSRVHLANGVLGYVASLLWLLFMLGSFSAVWQSVSSELSIIALPSRLPGMDGVSLQGQGITIFTLTMGALFLPKILCLIDVVLDRPRRRKYGGIIKVTTSAILETLFSALLAPVLMWLHSKFVISTLFGKGVGWAPQNRDAGQGVAWGTAFRAFGVPMMLGLVWGVLAFRVEPLYFYWVLPVLIGLVFSPVVCVISSRTSWGQRFRRAGLLLTPEETHPTAELLALDDRSVVERAAPPAAPDGLASAILDPYVNALHVTLLRSHKADFDTESDLHACTPSHLEAITKRLLSEGEEALTPRERMILLCDADTMAKVHRDVWVRPAAKLAPEWIKAMRGYSRHAQY